jgi:hypothetical protein
VINQINKKKYFPFIYALFLFILINNLIGMVKRCLYDFINIFIYIMLYCVKANKIVNKTNSVSTFTSSTSASRPKPSNKNSYYLHPYYITGFVDGEGCFTTSIYKETRMLTG